MSDVIDIKREAQISDCGKYRYSLSRVWWESSASPAMIHYVPPRDLAFVMLNPSTADAYEDDPTIRRCVGFARRDDFHAVHVFNLFAGRATKPCDLFQMEDPAGPENERFWQKLKQSAAIIVCAWGADKRAQEQARLFMEFMGDRELHCLGVSKDGHPRHPLYLKSDTPLSPWPAETLSQSTQLPRNRAGGTGGLG